MPSQLSDDLEQTNKPVRILIADDHEFTREGLSFSLSKKSPYDISGFAKNGKEALFMVGKHQPDIILMDIGMPIMDGITATQQVKAQYPEIKVIILTSRENSDEIYACMSAGANAYCMKDITTEKLIQVIELVQEGAIYLDPSIANALMEFLSANPKGNQDKDIKQPTGALTERELEVLNLVAQGKGNKEISAQLNISINTVKLYLSKIIHKLSVDDRTHAAVKALQLGLISKQGNI